MRKVRLVLIALVLVFGALYFLQRDFAGGTRQACEKLVTVLEKRVGTYPNVKAVAVLELGKGPAADLFRNKVEEMLVRRADAQLISRSNLDAIVRDLGFLGVMNPDAARQFKPKGVDAVYTGTVTATPGAAKTLTVRAVVKCLRTDDGQELLSFDEETTALDTSMPKPVYGWGMVACGVLAVLFSIKIAGTAGRKNLWAEHNDCWQKTRRDLARVETLLKEAAVAAKKKGHGELAMDLSAAAQRTGAIHAVDLLPGGSIKEGDESKGAIRQILRKDEDLDASVRDGIQEARQLATDAAGPNPDAAQEKLAALTGRMRDWESAIDDIKSLAAHA